MQTSPKVNIEEVGKNIQSDQISAFKQFTAGGLPESSFWMYGLYFPNSYSWKATYIEVAKNKMDVFSSKEQDGKIKTYTRFSKDLIDKLTEQEKERMVLHYLDKEGKETTLEITNIENLETIFLPTTRPRN